MMLLRTLTFRNLALTIIFAYAGWLFGKKHAGPITVTLRRQQLLHNEQTLLIKDDANATSRRLVLQENLENLQAEVLSLQSRLLAQYRPKSQSLRQLNSQIWESQLSVDILRSKLPCRDDIATNQKAGLPIYLMVVGVEGAGHHALETVWHGLERHYDLHFIGYNPGLHTFNKEPDVSRAYQYSSIDFSRHHKTFENFLRRPRVKGKPLIIDSRNSYPEGFGVGNLARPDLVYLSQLDGDLIDLRTLVVYRDPTACVLSAVRRFQVKEFQYKNYQFQARAVEESLNVINNAIPLLPCGKVMQLRYEDFVAHPNSFAQPLSMLMSVRKQHLLDSFGELKAPSAKSTDPEVQAQKEELEAFFQEKEMFWPLASGERPLPEVDIHTGLIPAKSEVDNGPQKAGSRQPPAPKAPNGAASKPEGFLSLSWFLHLGFNNVRFIAEQAFSMASQLNRHLIVPSHLRMRDCHDPLRCERAGCELRKRNYWCPIGSFLDQEALQASGGVVVANVREYLRDKKVDQVKDAFSRVYADDTIWFDHSPSAAAKQYYRFHLGCELAYAKVVAEDITKLGSKAIKVFATEFASTSEVLQLDGAPHKIGLTPFVWSTASSLEASRSTWQNAIRYHHNIVDLAQTITNTLQSSSTYTCVHLRRGDFVKAGWLGQAADLHRVAQTVRTAMQDGEALYLATDERNLTVLAPLMELGAKQWLDLGEKALKQAPEQVQDLAAFGDYVGLVEQMVCAKARMFLGSKCSSFTGQIWNLRRQLLGDTQRLTVTSKLKN
eukprot:TRINITY_DN9125_c0_g1_i1.p1 TRINITY_DN9125_c0_g1~~TRINITY_DN9125_c0_g1_i1.p1  ORF type:complete len:775 (+),score=147.07 TRINITY_DN9125_c0_g1_i1:1296-3620(+)